MPIQLDTTVTGGAKIRVIGVGGGGGNAINNMIARGLNGVEFIVANTDKQALEFNLASIKVQVGKDTTRGLGAGANPEVGKKAIEENMDEIKDYLKGSDMIFITGGMGGGTGTGGAPVIAKIGQEINALVVGIVTKPFEWEGKKRVLYAEEGIKALREYVDALIVIPNQRLLDIIDKKTTFKEAFERVDEVLYNATKGISDIISNHGVVNVDFADVRTIMKGMGDALMGIGVAKGDNRAAEATQNALNSPLLDGISIAGAQGVLVNVTGGSDMTMHEIAEAVSIIEEAAGGEANLIHGVVQHDDPCEEFMVTVVATGFYKKEVKKEVVEATPTLFNKPKNIDNTLPKERNGYEQRVPSGFKMPAPVDNRNDNRYPLSYPRPTVTQSPRGVDALKGYDVPAIQRRGTEVGNSQETRELANAAETDTRNSGYNQPAFLRKMMD